MRRRSLAVVLFLILAAAAVLDAQQRQVRGRVRDVSGAALPGVEVQLVRDGTVIRSVVTGANGEFLIHVEFRANERFDIRVVQPGFAMVARRLEPMSRGLRIESSSFVLDASVDPLPIPPPPPPIQPDDSHAIVPVFYATDRERATGQPLSYGPERESTASLHLGRFDVSIPRDAHPSVTIVPGVTTIDVSAVDTSFIGHFYYAEARSVLTDLFYLLKEGFMPDQRAHLQARGQPPNRYWVFVR